MQVWKERIRHWLHQRHGTLTREMVLAPGAHGLGQLPGRLHPDRIVRSICGYCSTGCSLDVHLHQNKAINLTATREYAVNLGMACPKGWEALRVLDSPERATVPLLRNAQNKLEPTTWPTAIATLVGQFRKIQAEHGPHSVAFLGTGQMPTEELALFGALAKFGMGMRHGDGNTRQCMASAVVAYKQSFGFDAPPYTYHDLEESDALVFVGANPCIAHPILWERVMRNPHHPAIVVIDPRCTETTMQADLHLRLAPKSDLPLFYGVARQLIDDGAVDPTFISQHTNGFAEFASFVGSYSLERVAVETGLDPRDILRFVSLIEHGKRVSFWWTMGVNQSYQGVRTAQSLINLALMTGNIGRPGTGANSITGQCNAMGSRLFSNTTSLLGGHEFQNPEHRAKVASLLNIPQQCIPSEPSWAYPEIMSAVLAGKIKGLWIVATNPAHSWINQDQANDIFDRLDFLVVQDMYSTTETARIADLVLPAASWGEKDGTFINSERRIGTIAKVCEPPGNAIPDFEIFKRVAEAWGCGEMFRDWSSPQAAFNILKQLTIGRPCDITGIHDYEMLDERGGIQWPFPQEAPDPSPERRLFGDSHFYHEDGKARFLFEAPRPMPERPNEHYPFLLLTGRGTVAQWHTETRTRQSLVLRKLSARGPLVEMNPTDARKLRIHSRDPVTVVSQRGSVRARAFVTPTVSSGQLFMAMHDVSTNKLTDAVFDPYSHQPSYKACAVQIHKL
jgi:assimilatory nitrate reductase catalytic subunit